MLRVNAFSGITQSASLAYRPWKQPGTGQDWRLGEVPAHLVVLVGGDATIERRDDGALDHLPLGRRAGQEQLDGTWDGTACEHEVHGKTALASAEWANPFLARQRDQVGRPRPINRTRWLGVAWRARSRGSTPSREAAGF